MAPLLLTAVNVRARRCGVVVAVRVCARLLGKGRGQGSRCLCQPVSHCRGGMVVCGPVSLAGRESDACVCNWPRQQWGM
jgi:hypothetical protein